MSLWKPFRGNRAALETVEKHDGYVYFCVDDGSLFFDYTDAEGVLQRRQINAKEAESLIGFNPAEYVKTSDLSEYQTKEDDTLETGNTSIVGSINDLYNQMGDVSTVLANSIAELDALVGGDE